MQLSFVTKLTSEDCVFIFSHSGKTKESINLARQVKNQRKMITLTGNSGSELAGLSDGSNYCRHRRRLVSCGILGFTDQLLNGNGYFIYKYDVSQF